MLKQLSSFFLLFLCLGVFFTMIVPIYVTLLYFVVLPMLILVTVAVLFNRLKRLFVRVFYAK